MPRVSARAHKPNHKTVPLHVHQTPPCEDGPVATVRILKVGVAPAARSGSTWQVPHTVQPAQPAQERPQVIYARTIRSVRPDPCSEAESSENAPREADADALSDYGAPRQRIADLQMRALRAFSGLQMHLPTQRTVASTWYKPSTRVMTMAVAVYAAALFLLALLSR